MSRRAKRHIFANQDLKALTIKHGENIIKELSRVRSFCGRTGGTAQNETVRINEGREYCKTCLAAREKRRAAKS